MKKEEELSLSVDIEEKLITFAWKFHFLRGLKVFETTFNFLYIHRWLALKKKSESLIKYYIKVTCALK